MENPVSTASHFGLWLILLAIGGWLLWQATHNSTENNRYASGSIPITHESKNYGLINLSPCGALFTIDTQKSKEDKKK